jgi:hypothetical protein
MEFPETLWESVKRAKADAKTDEKQRELVERDIIALAGYALYRDSWDQDELADHSMLHYEDLIPEGVKSEHEDVIAQRVNSEIFKRSKKLYLHLKAVASWNEITNMKRFWARIKKESRRNNHDQRR